VSLKFFQCRLTACLLDADIGLKGAVKFRPFMLIVTRLWV
jgi:hypothetical protein